MTNILIFNSFSIAYKIVKKNKKFNIGVNRGGTCIMATGDERAHALSLAERAYIEALFDEYYDKLYRVAHRHLGRLCVGCIDDVIQETFKRACENFHSLASYDSAEAWLVNVCHHVAVDEVKYLCKVKEFVMEIQPSPSDSLGIDELLPSSFSEDNRDLLVRYYVYKYSANEIAADLKQKPATIRQKLSRIRKELRKIL